MCIEEILNYQYFIYLQKVMSCNFGLSLPRMEARWYNQWYMIHYHIHRSLALGILIIVLHSCFPRSIILYYVITNSMLSPVGVLENKSRKADLTSLPWSYCLWIGDSPLHNHNELISNRKDTEECTAGHWKCQTWESNGWTFAGLETWTNCPPPLLSDL